MLSGLGVAAIARGADLLPLATLALGGTLLHALNYTAFASLASLSTGAAAIGAGSQTLDRLGGLAGRMPVVAIGMLVAGLSLAFLPGSAGFASGWMLLQALFAAPRAGGLALQLVPWPRCLGASDGLVRRVRGDRRHPAGRGGVPGQARDPPAPPRRRMRAWRNAPA